MTPVLTLPSSRSLKTMKTKPQHTIDSCCRSSIVVVRRGPRTPHSARGHSPRWWWWVVGDYLAFPSGWSVLPRKCKAKFTIMDIWWSELAEIKYYHPKVQNQLEVVRSHTHWHTRARWGFNCSDRSTNRLKLSTLNILPEWIYLTMTFLRDIKIQSSRRITKSGKCRLSTH